MWFSEKIPIGQVKAIVFPAYIQPFAHTVLFDSPRRLSGTHFLLLSSEATHCICIQI